MHIVIAERQKGGTSMFPQRPMRNMARAGPAVYESAYDDGRKTVIAGTATNASRDGGFSLSDRLPERA